MTARRVITVTINSDNVLPNAAIGGNISDDIHEDLFVDENGYVDRFWHGTLVALSRRRKCIGR